jgi:flagellar motor switch protein FliG
MPQRSRVVLLNDIAGDILTMALKGSSAAMRESVLVCLSPRQRRMVESDLAAGGTINPREVALARRAISQEAIRLANSGTIELKEKEAPASEAA